MPHQTCSVCRHSELQAINAALMGPATLRTLAEKYGLSKSALERHKNHSRNQKNRLDTDELARIDAEIRKLHHAETTAKKRRDGALALRISREIRNWHETRANAVALFAANRQTTDEVISPAEALQLARAVVESHLSEPETRAWIRGLAERIDSESQQQATDSVEVERAVDE